MNPLTRWNQLNELEDLQHSLRSLFSRSQVHWPEEHAGVVQWIPLVHLSEDAGEYLITAELPQVKSEDIKVTIDDATLTITGDRKFDLNRKRDHPVERACGRFAHSFALPHNACAARVTAVFKNGVLTVHLAKNQNATPRQVEVGVATGDQIPRHQSCSSRWGINE